MHNFKAAYINELYKISKRKKITAAAIMCLIVIAAGACISCTVNNFMGINITGKSEFSLMILPVFTNAVIPLFTAFVCIDMFCGEVSANTLKTTLLTPVPRIKVYSAKVCAAFTFAAAMLLFTMAVSFLTSVVIGHTQFKIIKIILSYVISIIPLAAFCTLAVAVANIAKGSGSSFMLCVVIFLVFKILEIFNPAYSSLFFTSGLNMYVLLNAPFIVFTKLIRLVIISVGYIVMLFSAGFMLFDRKEI